MNRELFFNEVSSYLAANHPDIFTQAKDKIFKTNEKELFKNKERISEVLSELGIDSRFLPKDN